MDISYSESDVLFRAEVRSFIENNLPQDIRDRTARHTHFAREDVVAWQRILNRKGWAAPGWPAEYGGTGWTPVQRYIFLDEVLQAPAPEPLSLNISMVGPIIYTFGTDEQKKRFLPRILNLDNWFCQGFSEPGAGSDLASLRTSAVLDGDHYVIDGQKTWTTNAHWADWMFGLFRTDPRAARKQEGITFLLIDMETPGITVRPIISIDGHHYLDEVFFDAVRVPVGNRIGVEGKGWDYAKFLLGNERTGIARVGLSRGRLNRARAIATEVADAGGSSFDSSHFRRRCIELEIELRALEINALRIIDDQASADMKGPDPRSSVIKLRGAETQQATAELVADIAGPWAFPDHAAFDGAWAGGVPNGFESSYSSASTYLFSRATTIYGGASEIQRDIIAKNILGL